jgi:hypothetical protein
MLGLRSRCLLFAGATTAELSLQLLDPQLFLPSSTLLFGGVSACARTTRCSTLVSVEKSLLVSARK